MLPILGTTHPLPAGAFEDDFPNFPFGGICFLVPWRDKSGRHDGSRIVGFFMLRSPSWSWGYSWHSITFDVLILSQVIQFVTLWSPSYLEVTNNPWKGSLDLTIPKRSRFRRIARRIFLGPTFPTVVSPWENQPPGRCLCGHGRNFGMSEP